MVDLRLMRDVTVDPTTRRARVGGGATLADKDAATLAHGLASTGGIVSHTGVGGITLVGGMGWLTRKAGLALDALVSAEVVTADGRVLRAAEDEHADLFWALRGGGGNFGVVTGFEFDLVEVDPTVQFGLFFWDLDHGPDALRLARDVVATLPESLNAILGAVNAPPAPFVPEQHRLQPGYALLLTGFGDPAGFDAVADRLRREAAPLFEFVTGMPYVQLQQLFDEANPFGIYCYDKGLYLADLTDEVIAVITEHVARKQSPDSALFLYRLDGAYSRVGEDDTAFGGGRSPRYMAFILGMGRSEDVLAGERRWARSLWEALSPHAAGERQLPQRRGGRRPGTGEGQLRPQAGAARPDQGDLRPGQRVPPDRQHPPRRTRVSGSVSSSRGRQSIRAIGVPWVTAVSSLTSRCTTPACGRRDLGRHLVDLHLGEELVGPHGLAVRHEPGGDDALGGRALLRQRGERDVGHRLDHAADAFLDAVLPRQHGVLERAARTAPARRGWRSARSGRAACPGRRR